MAATEPDDPALVANSRSLAKKLLRKGVARAVVAHPRVAKRAAELAVTVPPAGRY